jgi:hypothetical protein
MTPNDDFIRQLEGYLEEYEGSTPLPEGIRDAVRAQLPSIYQRPAWWPVRRFPEMNSMTKLSLAAAAVVVAAFLGYNYLVAPSVGGPRLGDPSPTPSSTPIPALDGQQELAPGTYRGELPRAPQISFTLTVPEGWSALDSSGVVASDNAPPDFSHGLLFWDVLNVYADPSQPTSEDLADPPVGPTVDDLVNALVAGDGWTTTPPVDVTVGGYAGKMVELTVPSDADFVGCGSTGNSSRPFAIWTEGSGSWRCMQGPGQTDHVYVVDVAGERVVITLVGYPSWDGRYLDELRSMVESLEFETQ